MFILGTKSVASAGTRVPLAAAAGTRVAQVTIQAKAGNTGYIYVGDATVTAANGYRLAIPAAAVQDHLPEIILKPTSVGNNIDLNQVYIDSSVNAEGVNFLYEIF